MVRHWGILWLIILVSINPTDAQDTSRIGVILHTGEADAGYLVLAPMGSNTISLMDNDGAIVHEWQSDNPTATAVYLLEDGSLLRTVALNTFLSQRTNARAVTSYIERIGWDGTVLWQYRLPNPQWLLHHDLAILPNGNVLVVAWETISREDAIALGRDPDLFPADTPVIWADVIVEIDPNTDEIVWEWHVLDHLVQDRIATLPTFGNPIAFAQRININMIGQPQPSISWTHINSIDYHAGRDEILLTVRMFSEIWVIDHALDTATARTSTGDLLYRWGNPSAYDSSDPQQLIYPHHAHWIDDGLAGAGNFLVFDNGNAEERPYSTILEVPLPIAEAQQSRMNLAPMTAPVWTYQAEPATDFFSPLLSGAQRQPNGNTLITEGLTGRIFEVTMAGHMVWEYQAPAETTFFFVHRYPVGYPAFAGRLFD